MIDDGDRLPLSVFDEIRSLLDFEIGHEARFRVAIAGSSRLEERLNSPRFSPFSQRIAVRSWLEPFTRNETVGYLSRQMGRVATDYGGLTFSKEAARLVHRYAEGIPRVINQIADLSLYLSSPNESIIGEKIVQKAWALLQQIPEESSGNSPTPSVPSEKSVSEESGSTVEFSFGGDFSEEGTGDDSLRDDGASLHLFPIR